MWTDATPSLARAVLNPQFWGRLVSASWQQTPPSWLKSQPYLGFQQHDLGALGVQGGGGGRHTAWLAAQWGRAEGAAPGSEPPGSCQLSPARPRPHT